MGAIVSKACSRYFEVDTNISCSRSEAWRYTGPFTRFNRLRGSFPGLGLATVAFAVYLGYEAIFVKDEHGHGEIGQGKDHHTQAL